MPFFKVLQGIHSDRSGKDYPAGSVIESDEDLVSLFKNKFEEVSGEGLPKMSPVLTAPLATRPALPADVEDVTSSFDDAAAAGVTVMKRDGKYFVFDAGDVGLERPLNGEGLTKPKAAALIAEHKG